MIKRFALIIISIFLIFSILEISLRIQYCFKRNDQNSIEQYVCKYDNLLGWRGKPGSYSNFRLNINSDGFRGITHSLQKPLHKKRILILGDSFAWGFNLRNYSDAFPMVLENISGKDYEVLNFAVPGYSTDQEFILLQREAFKYKPDIVILTFFLDDVFNSGNIATHNGKYPKPYFNIKKDGSLELKNVPVPFLKDRLHLVEFIKERLYILKTQLRIPTAYRYGKWDGYVFDDRYLSSGGWQITQRLIVEMYTLCRSNEAKFMFVIVPSNRQYDTQNDLPQRILTSFAAEQNIPVLNLLPLLSKDDYFDLDLHWNEKGHRVAAEAIYGFLIKNKFIGE